MVGALILLAAAGSDAAELLERAACALKEFEGRVRIRTIKWGEEEKGGRERAGDAKANEVIALIVRRHREYRVRVEASGSEPAVVDATGRPLPAVTLRPPRGIKLVPAPPSPCERPPIVLGLSPRRRGALPSLRLELDGETHRVVRVEAEFEHRTEIHRLLEPENRR